MMGILSKCGMGTFSTPYRNDLGMKFKAGADLESKNENTVRSNKWCPVCKQIIEKGKRMWL
jgi:hypothetical protein